MTWASCRRRIDRPSDPQAAPKETTSTRGYRLRPPFHRTPRGVWHPVARHQVTPAALVPQKKRPQRVLSTEAVFVSGCRGSALASAASRSYSARLRSSLLTTALISFCECPGTAPEGPVLSVFDPRCPKLLLLVS